VQQAMPIHRVCEQHMHMRTGACIHVHTCTIRVHTNMRYLTLTHELLPHTETHWKTNCQRTFDGVVETKGSVETGRGETVGGIEGRALRSVKWFAI
jgi:hypothetical protein